MTYTEEKHSKSKGDGSWEMIAAPFDCSFYSINGAAFDKATDPEDETSIVTGISSFAVMSPPPARQSSRWNKGAVITYVRSSTPLYLYFLR